MGHSRQQTEVTPEQRRAALAELARREDVHVGMRFFAMRELRAMDAMDAPQAPERLNVR